MLSGVKFVPRDQILPKGGADDSGSDGSARKSRKKHSRRGRDREEKRERRHRRRRNRHSSDDSDEGSDSEDSIDEEEEKELSRSKRRRKHRRGRRDFSDGDESSSESDKGRGSGRGKRRGSANDDDDEDQEEEMGGEGVRASEVVRREMGLDWMLKPASSSQPESSRAQRADHEEDKFEPADDEVKKPNPKEMNPYLRNDGSGYPDESTPSREASQLLASSVVGDGGASWRLKALKRAKEQAAREGRNIEEVVEERWGSLGHLAASVSTSRVAPSYAHLQAIRGRKAAQTDNSETPSKGNRKEGKRGEESGGGREYLRGVSSREHAMRKPKADSTPWKRNRQNMSSEDQTLISSALASINKFSNDGSFMERINNAGSKQANVVSVEVDERIDSEPKSQKESSKRPSSVSTQNLNANQLAAKILQLRMKGKNEEADQLSREMETLLENKGASVEEPRHERERSSLRRFVLVDKAKGTLSFLEKVQMLFHQKNLQSFGFHGGEKKDLCGCAKMGGGMSANSWLGTFTACGLQHEHPRTLLADTPFQMVCIGGYYAPYRFQSCMFRFRSIQHVLYQRGMLCSVVPINRFLVSV